MNIIKTQITRTAEEITANGLFSLEYTVSDGIFERVVATVFTVPVQEGVPGEYLGTITYEKPAINLNFMNTGSAFTPLVADFERLLEAIRTSVAQEEPAVE